MDLLYARVKIFRVMKIHVTVFWVVTLYSDVVGYHRFGGPCSLHLQGEVKVELSSETLVSCNVVIPRHSPENRDLNYLLCSLFQAFGIGWMNF
jgi:hypothetical protein